MNEFDPTKLNWNPHSCSCEIEVTRYETLQTVAPVLRADGRFAFPKAASDETDVTRPDGRISRRKTIVTHPDGRETTEKPYSNRMPGVRLRGKIVRPCQKHVGFNGVVQTQRVSCPSVCGCTWQELHAGDNKERGLIGTFMETVCQGHKNLSLGDIPDAVKAEARKQNG